MNEHLIKYDWDKVSSASKNSDDMWTKDKYVIIRGYYCTTFYLEELINGELLSTYDPNRKTIHYKEGDLQKAINYVEYDIASRISEIRNRKLYEIGI